MADDTSTSLGSARVDLVVNTSTMDAGIASAKSKLSDMSSAAQQAYGSLNAAQQKVVDSLNRQVTALGKSKSELIEMKAAAAGLPTSIFDDFKNRIASASSAVEEFSLNNSNARRELGRLASDLANGNYGRFQQTALTLANYSGVLGKVFSGTGVAIAGVTALIAAFGLAAYEGSAEVDAYNKALLLTGNYAGVTAMQLQDMARQNANGINSQHDFAAALTAVASTGKFTASQVELVGVAAVNMQELSGQSIDKTIEQFEQLQHAPLQAVVALNDAQHFLTLSVYDQIKALQEQGDTQQAATLAMNTYADTIAQRKDDSVKNLGLIEQAWRGIKGAADAAASAAMNVGRPQTDQQKFDVLAENRDAAKSLIDRGMGSDQYLGTTAQQYYDSATQQMAQMQDAFVAQQKQASAAALNAQIVQDKTDSDAEVKEYATNAQKRAEDIIKVQGEYNNRIARAVQAGNTQLADQLRASEALVVAGIKNKYKDPKQAADPFQDLNGLVQKAQVDDSNFGINNGQQTEQVTRILAIVDAGAKLIKSGHDVSSVQAEVASGVAAVNDLYAKQADQLQTKNAAAEAAYVAALDKQNAALALSFSNQAAHLGMGDQEYQQQQQIAKAYQDQADQLEQIAAKQQEFKDTGGHSGYSEQTAQQDTEDLKQAIAQRVQIIKDGYAQINAAQANWANGANAAFQDFENTANNVAAQTKTLFTNAFNDMTDALLTFETTGKLSFSKFVTDILEGIAKIENAKLVAGLAQDIFGGGTGTDGGTTASIFDGLSFNPSYNAKGGIYDSPSLSTYSNGVFDTPQFFAFARGAGIFGEAGPEAIMPLTRDGNGNLGVRAAGGTGSSTSGPVTIEQNFTFDQRGNETGNSGSAAQQSDAARSLTARMKSSAKQTIMEEMQPGGILWKMRQGLPA